MTSVETNSNAALVFYQSDNVPKILKARANDVRCRLGGHVLQEQDDRGSGLVSLIDAFCDSGVAFLFRATASRATRAASDQIRLGRGLGRTGS
jgi:hypothetical protein